MKILVVGGTRYFGIPMVNELLRCGHQVTIATRGRADDPYGSKVKRIKMDRTDKESMRNALNQVYYDVIIDKIAYCSNDVKNLLDVVSCGKYIMMSSTAVYQPKHWNTKESDYEGQKKELIWCNRKDFIYDEVKRQAECVLSHYYDYINWIAVRYPVVLGYNDYTERLKFYVTHIMKSIPFYIDDLDYQMSYIESIEAGQFIAWLVDKNVKGTINGASEGTISIKEIISYVEAKTKKKAFVCKNGDLAPYNGEPEFSINTDKAKKIGFQFSALKDWIYDLLDYYIEQVNAETM